MKRLSKFQLITLATMPESLFHQDVIAQLNMRLPAMYLQLGQFWPCIETWEFGDDKSVARLLELIRHKRVDNPRFRNNDTAALWASRLCDYRVLEPWQTIKVNERGLPITVHGYPTTANYHYKFIQHDKFGYAYFKHAKHWDEMEILTTLSTIKIWHEKHYLFGSLEPNVLYKYICLLEDKEYELSLDKYAYWLSYMKGRITRLKDAENA